MIRIDVQLLTGRYVATRFNDRDAPEWPPHPARLFSALVATASEHDALRDNARDALEWLEQQGPPRVQASGAEPRVAPATYVPENTTRVLDDWSAHEQKLHDAEQALEQAERQGDPKAVRRARKAVDKARAKLGERIEKAIQDDGKDSKSAAEQGRQMLPDQRGKQPRTLPSVTPDHPCVRYVWPDAEPDERTVDALSQLAAGLVRLGHSSSLVACRVKRDDSEELPAELHTWAPAESEEPPAQVHTWAPADDGQGALRTAGPGQLASLERAHARHAGVEPRLLPARHQPYACDGDKIRPPAPRSVFGEWFVLREIPAGDDGRRLGLRLTRTEDITRGIRGALMHHADDPPPAVLSGHTPDGRPLEQPHVAFLPLPDVGSTHARGAVLGAAIVLPRDIDPGDRGAVLRALGQWEQDGLRLTLGRAGAMQLERIVDDDPRRTLDPAAWTRASRRWASVTPVALDENPGDLHARDPATAAAAAERAEAIVARGCERIGLPQPAWVQVMRRSLFDAAPGARRFMPFPRKGKGLRRVCVHVEMCFDEPVAGPVLLGAGRYFGLGLCRPKGQGW